MIDLLVNSAIGIAILVLVYVFYLITTQAFQSFNEDKDE